MALNTPWPFPQVELSIIWPLRSCVRGCRRWVRGIASSVPQVGSHCQAGVYRAGDCLPRARPDLPLPPHTCIPKCFETPLFPVSHTRPPVNHFFKCPIYTSFKYPQEWWLSHYPGQPVPVLDHTFVEGFFPNIQPTPPLEADSSCSISCYSEEETDPTCLQTPYIKKYLKSSWLQDSFWHQLDPSHAERGRSGSDRSGCPCGEIPKTEVIWEDKIEPLTLHCCLLETAMAYEGKGQMWVFSFLWNLKEIKDLSWLKISIYRSLRNHGDKQLHTFLFVWLKYTRMGTRRGTMSVPKQMNTELQIPSSTSRHFLSQPKTKTSDEQMHRQH